MLSTPNGWTLTVFLPTANTTEVIMSVYSKIEDAEGLVREALINALAEGEDQYLTDLFNLLNNAKSTLDKIAEIGFNEAGNSITFDTSDPNYNFTLSSDYLDQITFPTGDIAIGTGNADVISFPGAADKSTDV